MVVVVVMAVVVVAVVVVVMAVVLCNPQGIQACLELALRHHSLALGHHSWHWAITAAAVAQCSTDCWLQ